jgi:hypothetical protein
MKAEHIFLTVSLAFGYYLQNCGLFNTSLKTIKVSAWKNNHYPFNRFAIF